MALAMSSQELRDDDPDIAMLRVLRDDGSTDPATDPFLPLEALLRAYSEMRRLRLLDALMVSLQRQGRIGFYGAALGQEAVPIAAALAMLEDDWVFPGLREGGIMLARGFPLRPFVAQVFGNAGDLLKGRQMPSHQSGRAVHQMARSSCVGRHLPQAVGAAWAMRTRSDGAVAVAFCDDGATSQADFHAAMNFAGVWRIPCVILCQSRQGANGESMARQTASRTIAVKARAYGISGIRVDGSDLLAAYAVARDAIDRARSGGGATLIEAVTYPVGPRAMGDASVLDGSDAKVEAGADKDPLDRLRKHLVQLGHLTDAEDARIEVELEAEVRAAVSEAERLPPVDPASLVGDVYAQVPWHLREQWQIFKRPVGRAER